jgi:hypothetical protein
MSKDRCEHDQDRLRIAHDSDRFALQQEIASDAAAHRREDGQHHSAEHRVLALISEDHARERERHQAHEAENPKPPAVDRLVDQYR